MVSVDFSKRTEVTIKNMVETTFPGIRFILANYPHPLPKIPDAHSWTFGSIWSNWYHDGCQENFPMAGIYEPASAVLNACK